MTKTKKLDMELPKEGRFISSEFPILRENLTKIDQAIAGVEEKVDEKAPLQHTHSISDVTDLEAALKGKMAADKTFSFADLSDIEGAKDAANNYVLYKSSNNNFTFGSAVSLLGSHQHKIEDIVGLDDFRAKINEDLTSYGHLTSPNEWQSYNKFTSKVTMSGDLELLGNSSFSLIHNGEVLTSLSASGSSLKGPLRVDGEAVYTKSEIDKLVALLTKKPVEILMTESGPIPFPEGVTDNTKIEIWAWGGGGSGRSGGGGGGGCVRVQIRGSDLKKSRAAQIGRGGSGTGPGGTTIIEGILRAGGGGLGRTIGIDGSGGNGGPGDDNGNGRGGNGGGAYSNRPNSNGSDSTFNGGGGGSYGVKTGNYGHGGNSIFGGGGGGAESKHTTDGITKGGYSGKGGNGGDGNRSTGGGGGGYFPGSSKGYGGAGAILFRFFI
ncbi:Bgr_08870 family protein [Bartonella grahamii]|uniref:Bgr_08870 family protein n=2 Tax=Bartonella TaxID=773 RepID=UPI0037CBACCC